MSEIKKKILVLTDDMPWGHRSIARAIFNFLKKEIDSSKYFVELAEIKAETMSMNEFYTFAYRYVPGTNKIFHKISGLKIAQDILKEVAILNSKNLEEKISQIKPDLIISTYFLHSHSLVWWKKKKGRNFKLWTVAADPWTINPISFVPEADLNIVYDQIGKKEAIKNGVDAKKVFVTGWWTRNEMYQKFDYQKSREKLGFKDNRPIVFVGGGSLGTNSLYKLLPSLLIVKKKVGLIINTGTDKLAFKLVEQFIKILKTVKKDKQIQIKHLGWIDNMAEVLAAADIVFGKAGPNFLFDCVACKKPFVAMTHIGGQEDGNIDLIKKKKLGWIKERNGEISDFLIEYLEKPKYFENKFKKEIIKEGDLNKKSLPLILRRIKDEFK